MRKLFMKVGIVLALVTLASAAFCNDKPTMLVLGTAHFDNPGRDYVNQDVKGILSDSRQAEIRKVVKQLLEFEPTLVAVEVARDKQEQLTRRYNEYSLGQYSLGKSEVEQIGFRLAREADHTNIFAVDWNGNPPGDVEADYNWVKFAKENGQERLLAELNSPARLQKYSFQLENQSIGEWLLQINDPKALQASHRVYFDIARIGDSEHQVGANWVGTWYARNLKIFSRIVALAKRPDERIVVIYGQGHAYLLRQFAQETGLFQVVDVKTVLK